MSEKMVSEKKKVFALDVEEFNDARYKNFLNKLELRYKIHEDAEWLRKSARISFEDALKCVNYGQEFWYAIMKAVTRKKHTLAATVRVVNDILSTTLDYKSLPRVLRYRLVEYREWETEQTRPKREQMLKDQRNKLRSEIKTEIKTEVLSEHFGMELEAETNPDVIQR